MASLSGFIITLICISEADPLRNNYVSSVCSPNEVKLHREQRPNLRSCEKAGERILLLWSVFFFHTFPFN